VKSEKDGGIMGNKSEGLPERFLNYAVKIVFFVERLENRPAK